MYDPQPSAPHVSPIAETLSILEDRIASLNKVASDLRTRLSPVLRETPEVATNVVPVANKPTSKMHAMLEAYDRRLIEIIGNINSILDHLEL